MLSATSEFIARDRVLSDSEYMSVRDNLKDRIAGIRSWVLDNVYNVDECRKLKTKRETATRLIIIVDR